MTDDQKKEKFVTALSGIFKINRYGKNDIKDLNHLLDLDYLNPKFTYMIDPITLEAVRVYKVLKRFNCLDINTGKITTIFENTYLKINVQESENE